MLTIDANEALALSEEVLGMLEQSWPKHFEEILSRYPEDEFFIFSFMKKKWVAKENCTGIDLKVDVFHQPRISKPEPMTGTILRKVNKQSGTVETIWALPHEEALGLFKKGKLFANPEVHKYIQDYVPI